MKPVTKLCGCTILFTATKEASSRDIAMKFVKTELLKSIIEIFGCDEGLYHLSCKPEIRKLIFGNSYPDGGSSEDDISSSGILYEYLWDKN